MIVHGHELALEQPRTTAGSDGGASRIYADELHIYWKDGQRVRWALRDWPDDGVGRRTHGAALSLSGAVVDAWQEREQESEAGHGAHRS